MMLLDSRFSDRHHLARLIIDDVLNYFVDHLADVAAARHAIMVRQDLEGRRMTNLIDEFMSTFANACEHTNAAFTGTRDPQGKGPH